MDDGLARTYVRTLMRVYVRIFWRETATHFFMNVSLLLITTHTKRTTKAALVSLWFLRILELCSFGLTRKHVCQYCTSQTHSNAELEQC